MNEKWDVRFLRLAAHIAEWSKDPSTRVGAVAVRDRRIIATGYNGFPPGVADDDRLEDRTEKYPRIIHAEQNVVSWAAREGVPLLGASLYVHPFHPCPDCAKYIIAAGVKEVVVTDGATPERWESLFNLSASLFAEAGVPVRLVKVPQ